MGDHSSTYSNAEDGRLTCPQCGHALIRVARRPIDRLFSLFTMVHRFRCRNHECRWEGNIRSRHASSGDSLSNSKL
jgi:hypothetical protein